TEVDDSISPEIVACRSAAAGQVAGATSLREGTAMNMIQNAKANARRRFPRLYGRWAEWQKGRLPEQVRQILASEDPYENYGKDVFDRLQHAYGPLWDEYELDKYSTWRRGVGGVW